MKTAAYYQAYISTLTPDQRAVWNEAIKAAEVVLNDATAATWDRQPIVKVEKAIRSGLLRLRAPVHGIQLPMQHPADVRGQEDPEATD